MAFLKVNLTDSSENKIINFLETKQNCCSFLYSADVTLGKALQMLGQYYLARSPSPYKMIPDKAPNQIMKNGTRFYDVFSGLLLGATFTAAVGSIPHLCTVKQIKPMPVCKGLSLTQDDLD